VTFAGIRFVRVPALPFLQGLGQPPVLRLDPLALGLICLHPLRHLPVHPLLCRHIRLLIFLLRILPLALRRRGAVVATVVSTCVPVIVVLFALPLSVAPPSAEGGGRLVVEHGVMKTPFPLVGEHRILVTQVAVVHRHKFFLRWRHFLPHKFPILDVFRHWHRVLRKVGDLNILEHHPALLLVKPPETIFCVVDVLIRNVDFGDVGGMHDFGQGFLHLGCRNTSPPPLCIVGVCARLLLCRLF